MTIKKLQIKGKGGNLSAKVCLDEIPLNFGIWGVSIESICYELGKADDSIVSLTTSLLKAYSENRERVSLPLKT